MSEKVYEMEDGYKERAAQLLEFIKERDNLSAGIKIAPPHMIREGQKLLTELNEAIEDGEAALAKEYESYQNLRRLEDEASVMNEAMGERMAMVFIRVKYNHPAKLEEVRAALLNNYTPEQEQEFYDRVAILEATKLEEIIAEDKTK